MLRSIILAAARSPRVERLVETAPVSRDVVKRFVAGTSTSDALAATQQLAGTGLRITLDHLGEDTLTADQATATKDAYQRTRPKSARHWPHKKKDKPPGDPRARMASESEIQLAAELRTTRTAA